MDFNEIVANAMRNINSPEYQRLYQERLKQRRDTFLKYAADNGHADWLYGYIQGDITDWNIQLAVEQIEAGTDNWTMTYDTFDWLYDGTRNHDRWRFTWIGTKPAQPPAPPSSSGDTISAAGFTFEL